MRRADIDAARPGDTLRDDQVRGLRLRAFSSSKAFYLYYRTRTGQRREPKLGAWPDMTITEARERARDILARVHAGEDPALKRRAQASTIADLLERYIERHVAGLKSARSLEQRIRRDVMPALGQIPLDSLRLEDIEDQTHLENFGCHRHDSLAVSAIGFYHGACRRVTENRYILRAAHRASTTYRRGPPDRRRRGSAQNPSAASAYAMKMPSAAARPKQTPPMNQMMRSIPVFPCYDAHAAAAWKADTREMIASLNENRPRARLL